MQKGPILEFSCQGCKSPIYFSIFELEKKEGELCCSNCSLLYDFSDETFRRQLKKFEKLCHQIHLSEEILSQSNIGVQVGDKEAKIPFKILLTRLNSTLDLIIGNRPLSIKFRIEPVKDLVPSKA